MGRPLKLIVNKEGNALSQTEINSMVKFIQSFPLATPKRVLIAHLEQKGLEGGSAKRIIARYRSGNTDPVAMDPTDHINSTDGDSEGPSVTYSDSTTYAGDFSEITDEAFLLQMRDDPEVAPGVRLNAAKALTALRDKAARDAQNAAEAATWVPTEDTQIMAHAILDAIKVSGPEVARKLVPSLASWLESNNTDSVAPD